MLRLLLKHKASIDLQSTQGASALMLAAYQGSQECVQELLAAGASTELLDGNGHTALETAESRGHAAITGLLRQHAAKAASMSAKRGELQLVVEWLQQTGGHVDDGQLLHAAASGGHLCVV